MAGITHLKQFQKPALRGLVDATKYDYKEVPDIADTFMPDDQSYNTSFAYDIIKKSNHVAGMIGYGAEPPVMDRDQVATEVGEVAKMGLKSIVTEEELLQLNQSRNNSEHEEMIRKLAIKGTDLTKAMLRRVDLAKMRAIAEAKFEYNKNGAQIKVDFKMLDDHKKELDKDDDWSDKDHDVIGDMLDWVEEYQDNNNGQSPEVMLMSRETQALLLKNAVVISEVHPMTDNGPSRVSIDNLNEVLNAYDLPPIKVVSHRKIKVRNVYTGEDEEVEFFPKNRVVMVAQGVGNFVYGPTAENEFAPGIVLDAYDHQEPIQSIFRVAAAGFPVVETPHLLFHADVVHSD